MKTRSSKSPKIDIFFKGVNTWFLSKHGHFPTFFLANIGEENVFDNIIERRNAFVGYKNKKFKKSKNWRISKGVNPWFRFKNGHFSKFFFWGNISKENVFDDILERKIAFLGFKIKKFKKLENWKLVFFQKWPFFQLLFLGNTGQ